MTTPLDEAIRQCRARSLAEDDGLFSALADALEFLRLKFQEPYEEQARRPTPSAPTPAATFAAVADALPTDAARDAAIRALCDFAEQPHPGRAGEAIDALERHLRAAKPARATKGDKGR